MNVSSVWKSLNPIQNLVSEGEHFTIKCENYDYGSIFLPCVFIVNGSEVVVEELLLGPALVLH